MCPRLDLHDAHAGWPSATLLETLPIAAIASRKDQP